MEDLPMLPERMKLVVIGQTSKQFKTVSGLLKSNDTDRVIIATDAGREGELVARWIIAKAGCRKPMQRLWISSQTDKAIREARRTVLLTSEAFFSKDAKNGTQATKAIQTDTQINPLSRNRKYPPTASAGTIRRRRIREISFLYLMFITT